MAQGQTNHVKATPVIYMHIIYSYSFHFDWLVSSPFHRKCPVSVVNACLETVHVKTVSHIKGCKCRILVMLCWYARVNVTTRLTLLDLDPSPSIIIIMYHNYETTLSDPKLALISLIVSLFKRMGKQNDIHFPGDTIIAF